MTGTPFLAHFPEAEALPGGVPPAPWYGAAVSFGMSFADTFPGGAAEVCLAGEGLEDAAGAISLRFDAFAAEEAPAAQAAAERPASGRRRHGFRSAGLPAARCWTVPRVTRHRTAATLRRA